MVQDDEASTAASAHTSCVLNTLLVAVTRLTGIPLDVVDVLPPSLGCIDVMQCSHLHWVASISCSAVGCLCLDLLRVPITLIVDSVLIAWHIF